MRAGTFSMLAGMEPMLADEDDLVHPLAFNTTPGKSWSDSKWLESWPMIQPSTSLISGIEWSICLTIRCYIDNNFENSFRRVPRLFWLSYWVLVNLSRSATLQWEVQCTQEEMFCPYQKEGFCTFTISPSGTIVPGNGRSACRVYNGAETTRNFGGILMAETPEKAKTLFIRGSPLPPPLCTACGHDVDSIRESPTVWRCITARIRTRLPGTPVRQHKAVPKQPDNDWGIAPRELSSTSLKS